MNVYEFGPFQVDPGGLLLLHRGEPVALGPKVVETLLALLEHPGDVLAKSDLLERIWPEGYVEEANLAQNIYVIRKVLRAHWEIDAIETVPRRGYRFTAPVRIVQRIERSVPLAPEPARRRVQWLGGVLVAAAIALLVLTAGAARVHRDTSPALSQDGARYYQIGRYYWNLRSRAGIQKSLEYFNRVVASDPRDARGYAALAQAYAMMGDYEYGREKPKVYFARARGFAGRALALDDRSAEAHAALGLIALDLDDLSTATSELQRALAYDSACGPAHEWYGIALLRRGRLDAASAQLEIAADLDPLSVATAAWLGSAAYLDHHYKDAIAYSEQALELSPGRTEVLRTIGEAYEAQGDLPRAIGAFKRFRADARYRPEAAALLAYAYALSHQMPQARVELAYARSHARDVEPVDLAAASAAVGERSAALATLRKEVKSAMSWMAVENDPRFDTLRSEPAFQKMAQAPA
jgi:DNA-binding winged helix-turn-helix (wHTH) protein/Flp pilus assembly protein TadD